MGTSLKASNLGAIAWPAFFWTDVIFTGTWKLGIAGNKRREVLIVKIYGRLQTPGHLCSDASKGKLTFTTKEKNEKKMEGKNFPVKVRFFYLFFYFGGGGWGGGGVGGGGGWGRELKIVLER